MKLECWECKHIACNECAKKTWASAIVGAGRIVCCACGMANLEKHWRRLSKEEERALESNQ